MTIPVWPSLAGGLFPGVFVYDSSYPDGDPPNLSLSAALFFNWVYDFSKL